MANKGTPLARPLWLKQVEEAHLKAEEQKTAAAKAAFDATFNDFGNQGFRKEADASSSDEESGCTRKLANKPIGPPDPAKCTAAGAGIGGGAAGSLVSFVVVTKDFDGRRLLRGGADIMVKVSPAVAVGCVEQGEAVIKDHEDGAYSVTYVVAKKGNYMVSVECNGGSIQGSPFPVFFSGGNASPPNLLLSASVNVNSTPFANGLGSNMSSFPHVVSGFLPGMVGTISGMLPGVTGGAILPGMMTSSGEVCCDYLNGQCARTDCKLNHPSLQQLMAALTSGSNMGGLSLMPMAPSAAAMAAAQSIMAVQAFQAAQARAASATKEYSGLPSCEDDISDMLSCTLQVSNLSPLLTTEQLRQLFSYCGEVTNCTMADSRQLAYVKYAKPAEAKAALDLNNIEVGGRPLNVEMAKSLPAKKPLSTSCPGNSLQPPPLPVMMQQVVAMQQFQFQQALLVQQAVATQQVAAVRQASVKSAADISAVRAAEISKSLKGEGDGDTHDNKEGPRRPRSPSKTRTRSQSKSTSPSKVRHDHCSRSLSRSSIQYRCYHSARSHPRDHIHLSRDRNRSFYYRGGRKDYSSPYRQHDGWNRERDHNSRISHRSSRSKLTWRSRSGSPECQKEQSQSPKKREGRRSLHYSSRLRSPSKKADKM